MIEGEQRLQCHGLAEQLLLEDEQSLVRRCCRVGGDVSGQTELVEEAAVDLEGARHVKLLPRECHGGAYECVGVGVPEDRVIDGLRVE